MVAVEVKTGEIDITAVYQALAYRRAATHAYAVFYVPVDQDFVVDVATERVFEEAERVGVGVAIIRDPRDTLTWEVHRRAPRVEPDPGLLDDFVDVQLPEEAQGLFV